MDQFIEPAALQQPSAYVDPDQIPLFFGIPELMNILSISRGTAYAMVNGRGFPCGRVGSRIIISREQFLTWAEKSFNRQHIPLRRYKQQKG